MFNHPLALELAYIAVEEGTRLGASYADARYELRHQEVVVTRNGVVTASDAQVERGLGVRVLVRGAWGFCGVSEPTRHDVAVAVKKAVSLARAASILQTRPSELAPESPQRSVFRTTIKRDPLAVPLEDKVELLMGIDRRLRRVKGIVHAEAHFRALRQRKILVSSEGSEVDQELVATGAGYTAAASDGGELQVRSSDGGAYGIQLGKGWEAVAELDLDAHAEEVAEDAVALLSAPPCDADTAHVILDAPLVAHHVLRSVVPQLELDRVIEAERSRPGQALFSAARLGSMVFGSEAVGMYVDSRTPGGAGTAGFDDEGVRAQRVDLVTEGRLTGFLSSRETAHRVGLDRSNGNMRAGGVFATPSIRASNVVLAPQHAGGLEDLVADTASGVLFLNPRGFGVDGHGEGFILSAEAGWRVKNGQRTQRLKNPVLRGRLVDFWKRCDAVGDPESWRMFGAFAPPKSPPEEALPVGVGAAPARFHDVEVGHHALRPSDGVSAPRYPSPKRKAVRRPIKKKPSRRRARKKDTK